MVFRNPIRLIRGKKHNEKQETLMARTGTNLPPALGGKNIKLAIDGIKDYKIRAARFWMPTRGKQRELVIYLCSYQALIIQLGTHCAKT